MTGPRLASSVRAASVDVQSRVFAVANSATIINNVKRRQSSSCDQCRQSKRGCDASTTVLAATEGRGNEIDLLEEPTGRQHDKCSYCHKTGKECTFRWLSAISRRRRAGKAHHTATKSSKQNNGLLPNSSKTTETMSKESSSFAQHMSSDAIECRVIHGHTKECTTEPAYTMSLSLRDDICRRDTHSTISESLLRVYQDSMENALSCWLTESNCPYILGSQDITSVRTGRDSCRILQRICKLDEDLAQSPAFRLTLTDQKRSSTALKLAMMSFATQWAQSGPREKASHLLASSTPQDGGMAGQLDSSTLNDESFGRSMQESLWYQARKALQDAEGILSSRVTFAFIIFSLTQRPLKPDDEATVPERNAERLMELDEQPNFLDSALRQLSGMKRVMRRALASTRGNYDQYTLVDNLDLDVDSRHTFDLLFWLGVMFDTLSAVMHDRPVVVADEDTEHTISAQEEQNIDLDGWKIDSKVVRAHTRLSGLWNEQFLEEDPDKVPTVWPCANWEAEDTLRKAAPVKVLFFRRVGQVQALLCRNVSTVKIERAIENGLLVYSFWQSNFQPFINSCVRHHEELVPKLQSWYGVLAGHWHLAAMKFADVVEEIDHSCLSCPTKRLARKRSSFFHSWRLEHSLAISDLADAALCEEVPSFSRGLDFHFALNKSALLSEPWTAVLIRSYSRAASFLLEQLTNRCSNAQDMHLRAQRCIEALLLIGKKSDIALLVAKTLRMRMSGVEDLYSQSAEDVR